MSRARGASSVTSRSPIRIVAAGHALQPGDHAQQRRLPAARRADEHDELAVADGQVDVVDGDDAAGEDLAHALEADAAHRALLPRWPGGVEREQQRAGHRRRPVADRHGARQLGHRGRRRAAPSGARRRRPSAPRACRRAAARRARADARACAPEHPPRAVHDRPRHGVARVRGVEARAARGGPPRPAGRPPRRVNACSSAIASAAPHSASAALRERRRRAHPQLRAVDGAQPLGGRGGGRRRASGQKPRWKTRPSGWRAPIAL